MIKLSVFYPRTDGAKFDMDYYINKHVPLVRKRIGAACKGVSVEQGTGGVAPGSPPAFVATAHFLFESLPAFQAAFAPHAAEIMGDIPNYTTIEPIMQFGDIKM